MTHTPCKYKQNLSQLKNLILTNTNSLTNLTHIYSQSENLNTLKKLTRSQNKFLTDTTCIFQLKQIYQTALRNPLYVLLRVFSPCGRISKVTESFAIIFFHVQWISIFLFKKINFFFPFHIKKNPHLVKKPKPNLIRNLMQYLMVNLYNT